MLVAHKPLLFLSFLCLLTLLGCGAEASSSSTESNALKCGPNSTLHQGVGEGAEAHCDCNKGFQLFDDECISDDSPKLQKDVAADTKNPAPTPDAGSQAPAPDAGSQGNQPAPVLPASCWQAGGALCDPRGGKGCDLSKGDTCDLAQTQDGQINLACLPGPNTKEKGQPCQATQAPFCAVGLHCTQSKTCQRFCCEDSDCNSNETCNALSANFGTLGVCDDGTAAPAPAPQCAGPGASCQKASDCCSQDCHFGHCH